MRSWPDDVAPDDAPAPDLDELVAEGRWGDTAAALRRLEAELPGLEHTSDPETLLLGLYGRVELQRLAGVPVADAIPGCDVLERAAVERRSPAWVATACALRANLWMESGDVGAAMADLARVDLDQLTEWLDGPVGARLLSVLAAAYARLRLVERLDETRVRLDEAVRTMRPATRATHWAGWATELAGRALEPVASGAGEPDERLLGRAVDVALRVSTLESSTVPDRLRRSSDGVLALAAAYRGRPSEALRLLGQDAFGDPKDLPPLERQVVRLAAMHAHALVGSIATARSLDDAGCDGPAALPHLVLEVCRARERLWLEGHAGGDVVPVLHRLTELLVRLGWQGMDLVADTARQALEHQALRTESRTDPLTGAGNRRALDEELRHILRFTPLPMSLVLVDVDDFKGVNDRFTHVIGDEVLRRVAGSLSSQLRVGDRLLRYGGDEFVVLLPRTGDQEARQVATRMTEGIAELPWSELADGLDVRITTGCAGLWSLTERRPERDAEQLFRRADETLLEAKRLRPDRGTSEQEWRSTGRRVALREAPGPTMAPPDREPRVEAPVEIRLPASADLGWDGPVGAGALSTDLLGADPLGWSARSPQPPAGSSARMPFTGAITGSLTLSERTDLADPGGPAAEQRPRRPAGRGLRTPPLGVAVTPGRADAGRSDAFGGGSSGPHTPPLGQHELVSELIDAAETLDEAVSHVTAPGIPVITGAIAVPRRGRRALGPPDDWPADDWTSDVGRSGSGPSAGGQEDGGLPPEPSGARRPAVIDLEATSSGRRSARRTPPD